MEIPAATRRWLDATWPFVRSRLPPAPCQVLELGCGPAGGFVPALREHGYQALGIDPVAPPGPDYRQVDFERYKTSQPVEAVIACTSLHHVADLDQVIDGVAAALTPGGLFIVVEWAYERFDEQTARWCFANLPDTDEPGWLHTHYAQWREFHQPWGNYLDAWSQRERLHSGEVMTRALQERFTTRLLDQTPYFFSDLHPVTEADERAAADTGAIQATGVRYVGTTSVPR